jgi:peptide/nickel transport system ATP-binding protein
MVCAMLQTPTLESSPRIEPSVPPTLGSAAELDADVLLEVCRLRTHFATDDGVVRAVDGVDLKIRRGRTLGIVGESGCGKSVLSRSIIRTVPEPPAAIDGEIRWRRKDGDVVDLAKLGPGSPELRGVRGRDIAMIFQEPMRSLSPVHTVGNQVMETLRVHEKVDREEARRRAIEMLGVVGIPNPKARFDAYPFEMSGGMRQRAMIAMALMCRPDLLIADEPTTALDVTVAAAILKLLKRLQAEFGMSIMIITHDLGVVASMADEVAVMYLGRIVEQGPVDTIFSRPQHPYTQALMRSMPRIGGRVDSLTTIRGNVPDPFAAIPGCSFSPRCSEAEVGLCTVREPRSIAVGPDHSVRCLKREAASHAS